MVGYLQNKMVKQEKNKKVMKSGLMLGVNPNSEREENDFYATNPKALKLFLEELEEDNIGLDKNIWECSCGQGHLSKELIRNGFNVKSSDLINRGFGEVKDFLKTEEKFYGDILTNPPFKLADKFVEKGISLITFGSKLILFLKIQFLESEDRYNLFKKYPLKYVYVHSSRQQCAKDGRFDKYKATTQFYAWFVWEKGFNGRTEIRWIKPKIKEVLAE